METNIHTTTVPTSIATAEAAVAGTECGENDEQQQYHHPQLQEQHQQVLQLQQPNQQQQEQQQLQELWWYSPNPFVPIQAEHDLLPILLPFGASERGMLKNQSEFRIRQIQHACQSLLSISLAQACSLRRHHIKQHHPFHTMTELGLGSHANIRTAAALFEKVVAMYLRKCHISYKTEQEQRQDYVLETTSAAEATATATTTTTRRRPPTPDFIFPPDQPVLIVKYDKKKQISSSTDSHIHHDQNHSNKNNDDDVGNIDTTPFVELERRAVHWMEAKMFYGASTIPHDNRSAVGQVLSTATKYVQAYGPGAMVFMYGCGDQLAHDLAQVGVMVLDCSDPQQGVDLRLVEEHQQKWCCSTKHINHAGVMMILP